ncbi:MAG: hypothetical protein H6832_08485 [Planctomycetes bacterium]|nr:hypothetical protein [Planctomycetota bacterium]MCB9918426.1 hypothetical protein [Planctomycetota bacterium]
MGWTRTLSLIAFAGPLGFAAPLDAQGASARVRAKVVDEHVVLRCQLTSPTVTMPAYLFVAYDRLCGIELHNQATNGLEIEDKFGGRKPFQIEFPGLTVDVDAREHGDEDFLNDFTKLHAPELEEIGVLGTIGANILMKYHVTFDLASGFLTIADPKPESNDKPEGPEKTYIKADATTKLVWLPVTLQGKHDRVVGIGSSQYDSIIDETLCEEFDALGGNIGSVQCGAFDLSTIVPWRPEELPFAHERGALGIVGVNFLECFRVEIDRVNGWVGLTRTRERPFPVEERAFFEARASEEVDEVHAWLEANQGSRLAKVAAESLLVMHMDNGSPFEQLEQAVTWVHRTRPETLRATRAIKTVDMLAQARLPEAAVRAGELGITEGRLDRYPESVHRLHVRLGEILLDLHRDRDAWEHLMSAAFGLNDAVGAADQARVNLLLGEYYERTSRLQRAASRYVQAVITPEAGEAAIAGLTRVQEKLGGDRFSVDLVDRLISGKVRAMTAPTKFVVDDDTNTNHCVLVEHVTNPHLGVKKGERWRAFTEGGAMIFQALLTHFPRDRVVLIGYHSAYPRPVGITNELSLHASSKVRGRPTFFVDGRAVGSGAVEYDGAEAGYAGMKRVVRGALGSPSDFELELHAGLQGGAVTGDVVVRGPRDDALRVEVLLAEKGVLYPGLGATVVHRMVARAALTEELSGVPFEQQEKKDGLAVMRVPFSRGLAAIEAANRAFLDDYEEKAKSIATRLSTGMDPDQLVVIACLRDSRSGAVLQAAQVDLGSSAASGDEER